MAKDLFLEIGSEEIPARFIKPALDALSAQSRNMLESHRISHGDIQTMATPRRLVLVVFSVKEQQDDTITEILGPPVKVAYDAEGKPTAAALGFARRVGLDVAELKYTKYRVNTQRGEYLAYPQHEAGKPTVDILSEALPALILSIPFPKSMRWADLDIRFVRPIHWIVAIFGEEVIPFTLGNISSERFSRGHRFTHPQPFEVKGWTQYLNEAAARNVYVDPEKRKSIIISRLEEEARAVAGHVLKNIDLLEEVSYMVEYPFVLPGSFPSQYLRLPREVLISVQREHQRYFSVLGPDGALMPYFIAVSNTPARNPDAVRKGNERVLRARLADAEFYFQEDRKISLAQRVESLKNVVFHADLGTAYEKMARFRRLARRLAELFHPRKLESVDRAAFLCKADLVTGMVGEFPGLQGIIGREYALLDGEPEEVARAISDHYRPASADDALPETEVGALLGLADRVDTIVGCFGVGLLPTGTSDPLGLRRHTLAVLNIILKRGYRISVPELIQWAIEGLTDRLKRDPAEVKEEVLQFFRQRLQNMVAPERFSHDVAEAVLSRAFNDPVDALARMAALQEMKRQREFEPLAIGVKRVINILKDQKPEGEPDPALFLDEVEHTLLNTYIAVREAVKRSLEAGDYTEALRQMARLRGPIDNYFGDIHTKGVLVMDPDESIRRNRLATLHIISRLFSGFADFSKIAIEDKQ